ncbi:uncharacterized protein CLUP02_12205 [Colletotrichum lupini]|uniref:Uncharacterized protein n=1 Tax=Colletotrichum lupini TaxID=145971 RepID=A0A9Q8T0N9_9PEZI|nr:uncharacterized protein CLUP02_12205 [Colletotrichum lupini]UQC86703.1 hypothetical protein CLUP02_12205 [Colletotrichum lupini]
MADNGLVTVSHWPSLRYAASSQACKSSLTHAFVNANRKVPESGQTSLVPIVLSAFCSTELLKTIPFVSIGMVSYSSALRNTYLPHIIHSSQFASLTDRTHKHHIVHFTN